MRVYSRSASNAIDARAVEIEVRDQGSVAKSQITPPPARSPGDFRGIWLEPSTGAFYSDYLVNPVAPIHSDWVLVSTVGTYPRSKSDMKQQQDNNFIVFVNDLDFDPDYGSKQMIGDGLWKYRGANGAWPVGLTRAIYLRGECGRRQGTGAGISQINFASRCTEGTSGRPTLSFVTQVKGYSSENNRDMAQDWLRVVIDEKSSQVGVMINDRSLGMYLHSGYELKL